ncbi:MAG: hypothetical protein DI587_24800 [Variovorax paradoxus]|nr:MAG: hypothetical protein DI583_24800 [Variovorax paradoxus]PZQ05436.1 MAG: hypothetical protein DI587_24800 [Variovorax paradoxus]
MPTSQLVSASSTNPPSQGLTFKERWESGDDGLLCCWLRGREKAIEDPQLAVQARTGELPILPWKGGISGPIKAKQKLGSLQYLAMWQGIRGDDLNVDLLAEVQLTCSKTGVTVKFTGVDANLAASEE